MCRIFDRVCTYAVLQAYISQWVCSQAAPFKDTPLGTFASCSPLLAFFVLFASAPLGAVSGRDPRLMGPGLRAAAISPPELSFREEFQDGAGRACVRLRDSRTGGGAAEAPDCAEPSLVPPSALAPAPPDAAPAHAVSPMTPSDTDWVEVREVLELMDDQEPSTGDASGRQGENPGGGVVNAPLWPTGLDVLGYHVTTRLGAPSRLVECLVTVHRRLDELEGGTPSHTGASSSAGFVCEVCHRVWPRERIPFTFCRSCRASPSWHHGRCCGSRPRGSAVADPCT